MNSIFTRYRHLLLAISSGILAWLSWPGMPFSFLIFIAWIPLLRVAIEVKSSLRFFGLCFLSLFIWNLGTTWWIWNATGPGAVSAWLISSSLMCLPWMGFHYFRKRWSPLPSFFLLVALWMSFEYLQLQDWGLSWSWLTLGNVFAMQPEWIQWYSYTGVAGGSLWIWLANLFLFLQGKSIAKNGYKKTAPTLVMGVMVLAIPMGLSWSLLKMNNEVPPLTNKTSASPIEKEVVLVQPNIDPYEKVAPGTTQKQVEKLLQITRTAISTKTALVIWPETALFSAYGFNEAQLNRYPELEPIRNWLGQYPTISLFTGIESFRWMDAPTKFSISTDNGSAYYEAYNGSALMDKDGTYAFYHKSMLVPGVESLPWFLRFLDQWFKKFGGVTAGYAKQENRSVLLEKNGISIAPAICYESVYGDFLRRTVKKGANLIAIITNDGWWKNTPGHIQHLHYARLRALETGCWVARSANTGISAFINPQGQLVDVRAYNRASAIRYSIPVSSATPTFYVKHGDWLFQGMALLAILLTGLACLSLRQSKK